MKIIEFLKELGRSYLITFLLLIAVISLQFRQCVYESEHYEHNKLQIQDIITTFKKDTDYIDSVITSRKELFENISNLTISHSEKQDTILLKQQEVLRNLDDILVVQEEIKSLQTEILNLANEMKNLRKSKELQFEQ